MSDAPADQTELTAVRGMAAFSAEEWSRLGATQRGAPGYNPFISHAFLSALEDSGSVSADSGWMPCHLRLEGRRLSWVRRTRISGDGWDGADVPLGEAREAYRVRLVRAGTLLAETMVGEPAWAVPASIWSAAAAGGPFEAEVAQLSDVYGAGPAARRVIDV